MCNLSYNGTDYGKGLKARNTGKDVQLWVLWDFLWQLYLEPL